VGRNKPRPLRGMSFPTRHPKPVRTLLGHPQGISALHDIEANHPVLPKLIASGNPTAVRRPCHRPWHRLTFVYNNRRARLLDASSFLRSQASRPNSWDRSTIARYQTLDSRSSGSRCLGRKLPNFFPVVCQVPAPIPVLTYEAITELPDRWTGDSTECAATHTRTPHPICQFRRPPFAGPGRAGTQT
jgi:hypothetical protein